MSVKLAYSRKKPGSSLLFFYRRIPDDIKALLAASGSPLAGKAHYVVSLQTSDPRVAAPKITKLLQQTNEEWEQLRNPTREGVLRQARQLLQQAGIDPKAPQETEEGALWALHDHLDDHLPQSVREDETIQHGNQLDRHLSPVHRAVLQILQNRKEFTLQDCLDQYVQARPSTEKTAKLAFGYLRGYLGKDRDLGKIERSEVNEFVQYLLDGRHNEQGRKVSTGTVTRYLNTLKAAFTRAILENSLGIGNVFAKVEIRGKGKDVRERESFTVDQLRALHRAIDQRVSDKGWDQLRCIVTIIAETGARLAEVVGLATTDVHSHAAVAYIDIKEHPWRTLKNDKSSVRKVPITPRAMVALKEAHRLSEGSPFLFPHYTTAEGNKADTVSASLTKWIRGREGLQGTKLGNHSMRHTMRDLLRATGCPSEAADQIIGHQTPGMGARYGRGYPLDQLAGWLVKATNVAR
ncbi:tyrosine-type recombinase/integrase [Caballeronia telluris]|nr:tyrosine-type recombinase/integrase [Caballeronia telluris]